jgi:hypothetical protein
MAGSAAATVIQRDPARRRHVTAAELASTQRVSVGRVAADGIAGTIAPAPAGDTAAIADGLARAEAAAPGAPVGTQARRLAARTERLRATPH